MTWHRSALSFDAVLRAARQGEEWAWTRLIGDLAGALTAYLRLRGARDPEDLAGEALLRVARGIQSFEGDDRKFRSWVFTIAHHLLIDQRRQSQRSLRVVSLDESEREPLAPDLDEILRHRWDEAGLGPLLAALTPDQREVVLLRVVAELSIAEVAEMLGKAPNAVKQLQHRGLQALRRNLAVTGELAR